MAKGTGKAARKEVFSDGTDPPALAGSREYVHTCSWLWCTMGDNAASILLVSSAFKLVINLMRKTSMLVMQDRLLPEVASSSWQASNNSIPWRTWPVTIGGLYSITCFFSKLFALIEMYLRWTMDSKSPWLKWDIDHNTPTPTIADNNQWHIYSCAFFCCGIMNRRRNVRNKG